MRSFRWSWFTLLVTILSVGAARGNEGIRWQNDLEVAKSMAAQSGRLVLVHFWATWCKPCVQLENEVFSQPTLGPRLAANYVPVKLDFDQHEALARQFGVESIPTDVVMTADGTVVERFVSPSSADAYLARMQQIAARSAKPNSASVAYNSGGLPGHQATGAPINTAEVVQNPSAPATTYPTDDRYAEYFARRQAQDAQYGQPNARNASSSFAGQSQHTNSYDQRQGSQTGYQQQGPYGGTSVTPIESTAEYAPQRAMPDSNRMDTPPSSPLPASPSSQRDAMHQAQPNNYDPRLSFAGGSAPGPHSAPPRMPHQVALGPNSHPGLDGQCPVTLVERYQWVPGDTRFGAVHLGKTYLFSGQAEQQRFLAAPDRYSPVLSGNDPVAATDEGLAIPGRREHGVFFQNQIFLFANETNLKKFWGSPEAYAAAIQSTRR